jgi:hypothetical protein
MLADSRDRAVFTAEDPAIAGSFVQDCRQDSHRVGFALMRGHEFGQQGTRQQRNVTVGDHHRAFQHLVGV